MVPAPLFSKLRCAALSTHRGVFLVDLVLLAEASSTQALRIARGTSQFAAGALDRKDVGPAFGSE